MAASKKLFVLYLKFWNRIPLLLDAPVDNQLNITLKDIFSKTLCSMEQVNQSQLSKFNATQSIKVKSPSLAQSSIASGVNMEVELKRQHRALRKIYR